MPALFTIDVDCRVVRIYAWGMLCHDSVREVADALRGHPHFDPTFSQLSDLRDVTAFKLTHEAIAMLAARTPYAVGARRATVVGSDLHHGIAQVFRGYASLRGLNVRVFRDIKAAEAWLGLAPSCSDRPHPP